MWQDPKRLVSGAVMQVHTASSEGFLPLTTKWYKRYDYSILCRRLVQPFEGGFWVPYGGSLVVVVGISQLQLHRLDLSSYVWRFASPAAVT